VSAWSDRFGSSAVAGSGSRLFTGGGAGLPGGSGGVYHPTVSGQPADNTEAGDQAAGVVSINPIDPIGTIEQNANPIANLLDGLKNGLFGTSQPDTEGKHGGVVILRRWAVGKAVPGGWAMARRRRPLSEARGPLMSDERQLWVRS